MSNEAVTPVSVPVPAGQAGMGAAPVKRARAWRALWVQVHLYLGLFAGALLVVFGLTGSILVFFQEIDDWLNPALLTVAVPPPGQDAYRPVGDILAAAKQAAAPGSRITQVYGATTRERVLAVYAEQPSKAWQRIFVDPYRARVTGVRSYGADEWMPDYFMDAVFSLHFQLLLGVNGITLAAVAAWLLLLSLVTGLIVWWPVNGQWRQAFVIRRPVTPFRFRFLLDLHKTLSLYLCLAIGAVLLSGAYMNWAEPIVWVTQLLSPATRGPAQAPHSEPMDGVLPISPEQAVAIATARYHEGRLSGVSMPEDAKGVYQVGRQAVPGLSAYWSERVVSIDQYSGEILDVRAPDMRRSAGETFLDWQWPLHSGQAFGMPGRLLVCVSGLACPVIYVTGVLMWWRKRAARRRAL